MYTFIQMSHFQARVDVPGTRDTFSRHKYNFPQNFFISISEEAMGIVFLLISLLVRHSQADTFEVLSNITKTVFRDEKTICYIHDRNGLEHILDQALSLSNHVIVNLEMDRLRSVTSDIFCNGYILCISDVIKFEDYFQNKNLHTFYFKPHRRLLLIFENRSQETPILQFIANLYAVDIITVSNLRYDAGADDKSKNLLVYSVYKNEILLEWNYRDELVFNATKFEAQGWWPKFYFNNKQFVFTISLFDCPPFVTVKEDGSVGGAEFKIIESVVKNWPVEYNILRNDKGMWSFIWKQMEANVSDVAACSMWQSASAGKNVDFTYPIRQTSVTFLVPKPQLLPDCTFFFQPFQYSIFLAMIFIHFILNIVIYLFRSYYEKSSDINAVQIQLHLIRIVSQGSIKCFPFLRVSSIRFVIISWICASIILAIYYQAGLTSNLTKPRYTNLVNTFKDMVDQKVVWLAPTTAFQKRFRSFGSETFTRLADLYEKGM